jgi:AcrR family transcriptional regulator
VLEAARDLFASHGPAVPLDEIARRAGVGAGTVYRHFPTKETLLEAVLLGRLERLTDEAHALSRAADAGQAFFDFAARMIEEGVAKRDLVDALASGGVDPQLAYSAITQDLRNAFGTLLHRAQQARAVRADVNPADVIALLTGASLATRHSAADTTTASRVLAVICDGLRPNR